MKCQHHGFCIGVVVWPSLFSSIRLSHIVDNARLRVDGG